MGNAKRLSLTFTVIAVADLLLLGILTLWQIADSALRGGAVRLDPDLWLAALLLFLLLLPTAVLLDAVSILLPRATGGRRAYLVQPIGGGLVAGATMVWLSYVEAYFTAPGYEFAYFMFGAVAGGTYGLMRAKVQLLFQPSP